jgi:hypothetical protein
MIGTVATTSSSNNLSERKIGDVRDEEITIKSFEDLLLHLQDTIAIIRKRALDSCCVVREFPIEDQRVSFNDHNREMLRFESTVSFHGEK